MAEATALREKEAAAFAAESAESEANLVYHKGLPWCMKGSPWCIEGFLCRSKGFLVY